MNDDPNELYQLNIIMKKLNHFVEDFIMFIPKDNNEIISSLKENARKVIDERF